MKKLGILAALTLALVAVLSPLSTAQATQAPAPPGLVASGDTVNSAISVVPDTSTARAGNDCIRNFGPSGPAPALVPCDSKYVPVAWSDGRHEFFVLGTDRQVWHSYQYSAGGAWSTWATLGDSNNIQNGVYGWFSSGALIVQVLGGDNQYWCNVYSGGWSNWHVCT